MQIIGDIREARIAILEVTERLRRFLFRDIENSKDFVPPSESVASRLSGAFGIDCISPDKVLSQDSFQGNDNPDPISQSTVTLRQSKVVVIKKKVVNNLFFCLCVSFVSVPGSVSRFVPEFL